MFDNIVSNKYFIIALVIALIVVIYLYSQKKSCDVEGMSNLNLTSLSQEITEKPWTEDDSDGKYKSVNKLDKYADRNTKKKTGKNGNFLRRKDEVYDQYMKYDGYEIMIPENVRQRRKRSSTNYNNIPRPLDDRQDLSQCQPCICPQDDDDDDDYDDDDNDDYDYTKNKRKNKNNRKKLNNY